MMDRSKGLPYECPRFPQRQQQTEYIKICLEDSSNCNTPSPHEAVTRQQPKQHIREHKRFTFNRNYQDSIKEQDEEDFCKVDCHEMIQLRNSIALFKNENCRLMQESADNMHLFNNYMTEMEQQLQDKNRELDQMKAKIRMLEQKCQKSEERVKRAETKFNNISLRNVLKRDCGVQCEDTLHRLLCGGKENKGDRKDMVSLVSSKQRQVMEKEFTQLKENHISLAQCFEKEIKLRKVQQEYDRKRTNYKTLTNTPRTSLTKHNSNHTLRLDFANNTTLNALVSPRTSAGNKGPLDAGFASTRHQNILNSAKMEKPMGQSTFLECAVQFERGEGRRGMRKRG